MSERLPPSQLVLSQAGVDVLSDREGCELTAYLDSVGVLTIDIGHTSSGGGAAHGLSGHDDYDGGGALDSSAPDDRRVRTEALPLIEVPCHQYEWDALCSFLFNLGTTQFLWQYRA